MTISYVMTCDVGINSIHQYIYMYIYIQVGICQYNQTLCNTRYNVCLDRQNCCYAILY